MNLDSTDRLTSRSTGCSSRRSIAAAAVAMIAAVTLSACTPDATLTTRAAADETPIATSQPAVPAVEPVAQPAPTAAVAATGTGTATTGTATATTGTATAATAAGGNGTGGPGSLTLSLTSPRAVSGHVNTPVTCVAGRGYRAHSVGVVQGYTVRLTASAARYAGPGTYETVLTGSVVAPGGEAFALVGVRSVADLEPAGGTLPFSATSARGRTLSGTLSWACS